MLSFLKPFSCFFYLSHLFDNIRSKFYLTIYSTYGELLLWLRRQRLPASTQCKINVLHLPNKGQYLLVRLCSPISCSLVPFYVSGPVQFTDGSVVIINQSFWASRIHSNLQSHSNSFPDTSTVRSLGCLTKSKIPSSNVFILLLLMYNRFSADKSEKLPISMLSIKLSCKDNSSSLKRPFSMYWETTWILLEWMWSKIKLFRELNALFCIVWILHENKSKCLRLGWFLNTVDGMLVNLLKLKSTCSASGGILIALKSVNSSPILLYVILAENVKYGKGCIKISYTQDKTRTILALSLHVELFNYSSS